MLSHTVLLVVGGALLTGLLGALVFGSNGTAEDRRIREERKLLRALEAQRRIRDAQLMRQAKRHGAVVEAKRPAPVVKLPPVDAQAIDEEPAAEHRASKRERKRHEKEQAAAFKAAYAAEKRAQRQAEQEHTAAAKAEQATLRAAEREQRQEAKRALKAEHAKARAAERQQEQEAKAALKAEHAKARAAEVPPTPSAPARTEPEQPHEAKDADEPKPLSELPLFSWANRIDDDDAPSREAS
jgi:hypothetical protein